MPNEHPLHPLILPCETTETNYNYNVGGEVKKTVPFTKELREWLLSFKAIGIRFVDTLSELRQFTKHESKQAMCVYENEVIYQFLPVTNDDDGENFIRPNNVAPTSAGRWVKKLSFLDTYGDLWNLVRYQGVQTTGSGEPTSDNDRSWYVDNTAGIDDVTTTGEQTSPFKTIEYAIERYGTELKFWRGKLTLTLLANYTDPISILNFFNCNLEIITETAIGGVGIISNIQDVSLYGNNIVKITGTGAIANMRAEKNHWIELTGSEIPMVSNIQIVFNDNVSIQGMIMRSDVEFSNISNLLISSLQIDYGNTMSMLRCVAHLSGVDGEVVAYNSVVTRSLAADVTGVRSLIGANI
jgi:hypothetical protein